MSVKELNKLMKQEPWEWEEGAEDVICTVLTDKKVKVTDRLSAIMMASESVVINDRVGGILLDILEDPEELEEIRSKAPIALGPALEYGEVMEFDDPDDILFTEKMFKGVRERLRQFFQNLKNPEEVRRTLLEGAVRAPMEWHRKAVKDAYYTGSEPWRITAIFCMGFIRGFEKEIVETLDSEDPALRLEALLAAGQQGIKAAWPYYKEILTSKKNDVEKDLLLAAIDSAAMVNPREALPLLGEWELSDDEEIAEYAEDASMEAIMLVQDDMQDEPEDY
ncbi:MAG: hypothetical protein GY757_12045 [bacterium]|nr:hypothetical protein [bacterium]